VRQRLIVIRDGFGIGCNAERACDLYWGVALRQLPEAAEQALGGTPPEHDAIAIRDPQRGTRQDRQLALLLARSDDRQLVLPTRACRAALRSERAEQAARRRWRAQRGAELHQTLVEIAGCMIGRHRGHQFAGALPQRALPDGGLDVVIDREHASEHTRDIAVDERRTFAIRDRRDCTGGVGPDAGHLTQLARPRRQCAGKRLGHCLRARVEVTRARVVAKARPRGEHIVERRGGERGHRRELRHPALPVRDHRLDARLLQHDLADPDRIWITRATPGQVAAVTPIVRDDGSRDLREIHRVVVPRLVVEVDHRRDLRHEDHTELRRRRRLRRIRHAALLFTRRVLNQRIRDAHAELPVP
jgi:hypothetical protein